MFAYSPASDFTLPQTDERVGILGRTGSGKTHFAITMLSYMPIDQMPFIVLNFKNDDFIDSIPHAKHIAIGDVPNEPGVYIQHPINDDEKLEELYWQIWKQGNCGLFVDELLLVDKWSAGYRALLTQGRSKNIPMIYLSQRPVDINRFNFSEASHMVMFDLNHYKDRSIVAEYMPIDKKRRLDNHSSDWYDVNRNKLFQVQPAPGREIILARFDEKLRPEPEPEGPRRIFI